jgi:FkbM family methyltransferase
MESKVESKTESKTELKTEPSLKLSSAEKDLTPKSLPFDMFLETEIEHWRLRTFWTKEPETLAWIGSFPERGIFYDIGANIGLYSLFCAKNRPKMTIFAFEPQLENYSRLCQNILLNGFKNIIPVYAGAGQVNQVRMFCLKSVQAGSTGGKFGYFPDALQAPDVRNGILIKMDDFSLLFGIPNYVKVDTDGFEEDVLNGMHSLLRHQNLKSMLIEFDTSDPDKYFKQVKFILTRGMNLINQWNSFQPHSRDRRKKEGIQVENLVFSR